MEGLLLLLILGLLSGAALGWVSFLQLQHIKNELAALRRQIGSNRTYSAGTLSQRAANAMNQGIVSGAKADSSESDAQPFAESNEESKSKSWKQFDADSSSEKKASDSQNPKMEPDYFSNLRSNFKKNWMIWLGGSCVALAGIFMVRYSMEQGLLGPTARIICSILFSVTLHVIAEWGRRRHRIQIHAIAALAGSASIILYAALLAALMLYQLVAPGLAFGALSIVSLFTMALAVVHGPILAVMGILGAFVVPLLVDTDSSNIIALYAYCLIISAASFLLLRFVYREWIFGFTFLGAGAWWAISLGIPEADGYRGFYLTAFAYLALSIPNWDLRLRGKAIRNDIRSTDMDSQESRKREKIEFVALFSILVAAVFSILTNPEITLALVEWSPLTILLLVASGANLSYSRLPALFVVLQMVLWPAIGYGQNPIVGESWLTLQEQTAYVWIAAWMVSLYTVFTIRNLKWGIQKHHEKEELFWFGSASFIPLGWLIGCYLILTEMETSLTWAGSTVGLGIIYLLWAVRRVTAIGEHKLPQANQKDKIMSAWLILAGHLSYSLAVAFMLREASLTVALATQLVSIVWLINRFALPQLDIYLKVILAVVAARLTLNPWLLTYSTEVHWSLWSYGGATLLCATACWMSPDTSRLRSWLELSTLHLFVLTAWTELRYWLYDGEVFAARFDLLEVSINMALWFSVAMIYYIRQQRSEHLKKIYSLLSVGMLTLAVFAYGLVLLVLNPLWFAGTEIDTMFFNILLLAYGFPVVMFAVFIRFYDQRYRSVMTTAFGVAAFLFISIEIRHFWHGNVHLDSGISSGEQYTYTIVWMIMAVLAMLAGSLKLGKQVYQAGFGLIMVVTAKIFIVDMSDLQGLLRVASFMGLGLCLLGMAYLYQRFNLDPDTQTESLQKSAE